MEVKNVLMKRVKYNSISPTPLSDFCKETRHSQKSWVLLLMNIHRPNRVMYDVSK